MSRVLAENDLLEIVQTDIASADRMETPAQNQIFGIERPDRKLMVYYFLTCLVTGPLFPILIVPAYFRYHTMRYRFDQEGVSMRWGILFRREIILNYARIQDIHLSSNLIERWLGLARLQIQTASGSAAAEMTLEGILEYERLRDFLYSKMRGLKDVHRPGISGAAGVVSGLSAAAVTPDTTQELTTTLREVAGELRRIRELLASGSTRLPPLP
jgi:putative membrane protein